MANVSIDVWVFFIIVKNCSIMSQIQVAKLLWYTQTLQVRNLIAFYLTLNDRNNSYFACSDDKCDYDIHALGSQQVIVAEQFPYKLYFQMTL